MSVNRQMAKGALWTVGLRLFHRAFGFISTLILARLLLPEDFGLVAMATVFLHLLEAVSNFSVHVPLIQKQEIDRADMDSAWSLQFLVAVVQSALLFIIASPVAAFFDEPRLVRIIHILAIITLIKGAKNIGIIMFQRDMAFDRDFVLIATQRVAMFVVTVTAAVIWRSYWALIGGMIVGAFVEFVLSYTMHPYRPRPSTERWSGLIHFSKWMLLNNALAFVGQRGPDFVLGRLIGPRAVGLFSVGYEVAMLPTTELIAPINRVALPAYSKLTRVEGELARGYLDVIGLIALLALPAGLGISATAEFLIPLLLGDQWYDAIPVVQLLAIAGAIGALRTNTSAVVLAIGRPALLTFQSAVRIAVLVPGIYFGASAAGVPGVALAYLVVAVFMLGVNVLMTLHVLALPLREYVTVVYRPVIAAGVMYAVVMFVILPWLSSTPSAGLIFSAVVAVIAGAGIFVGVVLGLWMVSGRSAGAESRVIQIASEIAGRRMPPVSRWLGKWI